jgi:3-oxoacid CoA-transferase
MKQVPIIDLPTAALMVKEGDTLLQGGFGMTGNPVHLMHALAEIGTGNLTFIGNNTGEAGLGGGRLLRNGQLKKDDWLVFYFQSRCSESSTIWTS